MSIVNKQRAVERLEPAIAGLKALTAEALGYDPELVEQCVGLTMWLQNTLDRINGIEIEDTAGDLERRTLIASIGLRIASLSSDIELEGKLAQAIIDRHELQLSEAKFAGCRADDLPQYPRIEVEAHQANIVDLEAELQQLEAFLANPDDVSLLAGTEFEAAIVTP